MIATAVAVELVTIQPQQPRVDVLFSALTQAAKGAGVELLPSTQYRGLAPWLMLWGPGEPTRAALLAHHVAAGGHVLAWDLGYWHRDPGPLQHAYARISLDAAHPQAWILRGAWPDTRWHLHPQPIRESYDPAGPIVVAAIGRKARLQYGDQVLEWELAQIAACRARWPERPIRYRKKQHDVPLPTLPPGVTLDHAGSIDTALRGASLLVTWHSNVAVDAIRCGIPVVCHDGAAAALYPDTIADDPRPVPRETAMQFLHNLAWFQWAPAEAGAAWAWIREVLA